MGVARAVTRAANVLSGNRIELTVGELVVRSMATPQTSYNA
jgi:hypothetical protein